MGFWIGKLTDKGYQSPWIYRVLKPKTSGNHVNGLGEEELRQPSPILWHRLKFIRHRLVQLLFQSRFRPRILLRHFDMAIHFIKMKRAKKKLKKTLPNPHVQDLGSEATTIIKDLCIAQGAETVGVTKMRPEWMFEGYELPAWAQEALDEDKLHLGIMAVQHEKESFKSSPSWAFSKEIANQYNQGSDIAIFVANWILEKGYRAYGHGGPEAGEFTLTPAAIEAGLGELGKHGSLINPKLGANFRIACVYTTLELETNHAAEFGIDDFCMRCQICTRECPPDAISDGKKMVRGVEKFYVDFDKCFPYMTDNYGCGICLRVCPWSQENIVEKVFRKQQKRLFGNIIDKDVIAIDATVYQPSDGYQSSDAYQSNDERLPIYQPSNG
jgi:ferredoxin